MRVTDNQTAEAVGEMIAAAWRQFGGVGSAGAVVLRRGNKGGNMKQSLEAMKETRQRLRIRLSDIFKSRQPNADKADKLANRIEVLNVEIAAAEYKRRTIAELKGNAKHQTTA